MHRRTFLSRGTMAAGLLLGPQLPAAADRKVDYAADVEFLLTEFQKQAGHFFPVKEIDWETVSRGFRSEVKQVESDATHLQLCQRLTACLKDGHAGIVDSKVAFPDDSKGRRWAGPGVHLMTIGEEVYIRAVFREAASAGLKTGQRVTAIDGRPAREWLDQKVVELRRTTGYSTPHAALHAACHWGLAGWEGTRIAFAVETAEGVEKTILRPRSGHNSAPLGPVFFPPGLKRLGRQSYGRTPEGMAYIHLRNVPGDLEKQLDMALADLHGAKGLILDLRANGGGGCDHAVVFGRFVAKGKFYDRYEGTGENPWTGNMVMIIGAGVRSAGETVAGMFKETRRALTIGDSPTAGMSSSKTTITVPSGLFTIRFSVHSNMARYNKGKGIEGIGIPPHLVIPYQQDDLAAARDTLIRKASDLLATGFPSEEVDYVPPGEAAK